MNHRKHDGTEQGIFNAVVTHLFEQGTPSRDGGGCLYRGHQGRSCAIGCMIPDDRYMHEFEGRTAYDTEVLRAANIDPKSDQKIDLAIALQRAHDNTSLLDVNGAFDREALIGKLQGIAERFGLTMPEIPAAPAA